MAAEKGSIRIKPSHKGDLHRDLGVPRGTPLSDRLLAAAKKSPNPAERKRATFAENAKRWGH
jgi:hypothetical protein